ncbi:hypothetical protein GCM10020295_83080 [Streptomyces cinereospinus]
MTRVPPTDPPVTAEAGTGRGEETSASPENDTAPSAAAEESDDHDDVRVAEAWIASRQKHGHGVPARSRMAMVRDAAVLLAEGIDVEHLVAAAADMGSRANWYSLERHLEKFVPPRASVPGQRPALPDWCGKCNDGIEPRQPGQRMREGDDGRLIRCECHPSHPSNAKKSVA